MSEKLLQSEIGKNQESTVAKGKEYESKVVNYLSEDGFRIRERNFRCRFGEIDLIAEKDSALHFIEVKGQNRDWQSEMKINGKKRGRIEKAAVEYIRRFDLWDYGICFDVAIVTGEVIKYYTNAFEAKGDWL